MKYLLAIVLCLPFALAAAHLAHTPLSDPTSDTVYASPKLRCMGCARDSHGRIRRSRSARREFMREHPCPSTGRTSGKCPGYVVDHIRALKHGGADEPSNMQWQTIEDGKAKDKWE